MKRTIATFIAIAGLFAATSGSAQTATPKVHRASVAARQENQQDRIQQGIKSDELTRKEAASLEAQAGRIQAQKLEDKSDGKMTAAERAKLQKELNAESRRIYRLKHNDKVAK